MQERDGRGGAAYFFLQAGDGIRDVAVTGVQTCALPICTTSCCSGISWTRCRGTPARTTSSWPPTCCCTWGTSTPFSGRPRGRCARAECSRSRSEERRVGKAWRGRGWPGHAGERWPGGCGIFFFASRRRHTRCSRDWSSDVCSSDLYDELLLGGLVDALSRNPGAYDLVVAADVLLYLGDLDAVFGAAKGALREGGVFAFKIGRASCRESVERPGVAGSCRREMAGGVRHIFFCKQETAYEM